MTKKILIPIALVLILLCTGCFEKEPTPSKTDTDAIKFKEEYEGVNGTNTSSGKEYRKITIPEDNPMVYKTAEELVEAINNDETFVVYFGFKTCPWCRSILPTLVKVSDDLLLKKIYYVDISEIRDTMSLNSKGKAETTKEGSEAYYQLLELLDNVLSDYTLDNNGKTVNTKEKRIYAPNVVAVVKGEAKALTEGISDKQTDGYMELTQEMLDDTYSQLESVLKIVVEADSKCEKGC